MRRNFLLILASWATALLLCDALFNLATNTVLLEQTTSPFNLGKLRHLQLQDRLSTLQTQASSSVINTVCSLPRYHDSVTVCSLEVS